MPEGRMKAMRLWSLRHARGLARVYDWSARLATRAAPLVRRLGLSRVERLLTPLERGAKSFFFDCRMCGQCALSATGLACPMGCAKQMRNGPCGGVRADGHCEVHPAVHCTWVEAGEGDARIHSGHLPSWRERVAPLDRRRDGRSSWVRLFLPAEGKDGPAAPAADQSAVKIPRNPLDTACHEALQGDRFLVTVEIAPPDSPDPATLLQRAERFRGLVDAINITDGAGANCHMSSVAAAAVPGWRRLHAGMSGRLP